MKRLCTIAARGGSKGVPQKNIRMVQGKPLIAHSLLQTKESGRVDAIAVTSDSDEILEISKQWPNSCFIFGFVTTPPTSLRTV